MTDYHSLKLKIADWSADSAALKDIRYQVFVEEQHVPEELEWDEFDNTSIHFLAFCRNLPVATARLKPDGQIGRMAVLSEFRNYGIGSQLLKFVLETAIDKKFQSVYLHAQTQVTGFYKKYGFTEKGRIFMEANIPHQTMFKEPLIDS